MTIRHLKIYLTVCKYQSITKAADALNISQPAISIAIKELESFYDCILFERINRQLQLTSDGKILYSYALNIIDQLNEAFDILHDKENLNLRIGANVSIGYHDIFDIINYLREYHPNLALTTFINNSKIIIDKISDNQIDIGIVDKICNQHNLVFDSIKQEKLIALAHKDLNYPQHLSLQQLCFYPLILREKGSGIRACIDNHFELKGYEYQTAFESISFDNLLLACKQKLGILFIPEQIYKSNLYPDLIPIEITDSEFIRNYYLCYHQSKKSNKKMMDYIEKIKIFLKH